MTSKKDIKSWIESAKKRGATHLIVACDTFDYDDYPVSVMPHENIIDRIAKYNGVNMQIIMEVYKLDMDIESQLNEHRAYHIHK